MDTFTLDTSGAVAATDGGVYYFAELSPFAQGYVEAMFEALRDKHSFRTQPLVREAIAKYGFSDLAPETLAAILRDCEAIQADMDQDREQGFHAWRVRQAGRWPDFPPLTPYLSDDGKVRLREAAPAR